MMPREYSSDKGASYFSLPQDGGGSGWGLLSQANTASSGTSAPTLALPRLGGGNIPSARQ